MLLQEGYGSEVVVLFGRWGQVGLSDFKLHLVDIVFKQAVVVVDVLCIGVHHCRLLS